MNVERIRELADHLRTPVVSQHFDMDYYFTNVSTDAPVAEALKTCGTVACIAGHAIALFAGDRKLQDVNYYHGLAREVLDLTNEDALALFEPENLNTEWSDLTAHQAAQVLDHLAETGDVNWLAADGVE